MYIRRLIVQERVEDLQLGVESYQVKLNLTKPDLTCPDPEVKSQYVHIQKPFGFTYLNDERKLRFMRYNEIHMFSDATLKAKRDGLVKRLQDIKNFKLSHQGQQGTQGQTVRWNNSVQRQVRQFVRKIEERLNRRDQIRRLESYIGARPAFPNI